MDISFGWTSPALLAGEKTVTRREWADRHAAKFHLGDLVTALDKDRRWGGKAIAIIRLTADPCKLDQLPPEDDWRREGFAWLTAHGLNVGRDTPLEVWTRWQAGGAKHMWIVRFQVMKFLPDRSRMQP